MKNIYKKWWFWLIVIVIFTRVMAFIQGDTTDSQQNVNNSNIKIEDTATKNEPKSELDKIEFSINDVRNDVTGNWKISTISEDIEIENYALEYYNKYFKNDKEIHFIVNFKYNTTTSISSIGNLLEVTILEYVKKEEHDAKKLGGGMLLAKYHINKYDGKIEKIQ